MGGAWRVRETTMPAKSQFHGYFLYRHFWLAEELSRPFCLCIYIRTCPPEVMQTQKQTYPLPQKPTTIMNDNHLPHTNYDLFMYHALQNELRRRDPENWKRYKTKAATVARLRELDMQVIFHPRHLQDLDIMRVNQAAEAWYEGLEENLDLRWVVKAAVAGVILYLVWRMLDGDETMGAIG